MRKIRNWSSYAMWKELMEFLKTNPSKGAILERIHNLLDERRTYGSATNAWYSKRALDQVVKEEKRIEDIPPKEERLLDLGECMTGANGKGKVHAYIARSGDSIEKKTEKILGKIAKSIASRFNSRHGRVKNDVERANRIIKGIGLEEEMSDKLNNLNDRMADSVAKNFKEE